MQFQPYTGGGFCIHKITGTWKGNVSAYFNVKGEPIDAEYTRTGRSVKRGGPVWTRLETIGRVWKSKQNLPAPSN